MWNKPQSGTATAELTLWQMGEAKACRADLQVEKKVSNPRSGLLPSWYHPLALSLDATIMKWKEMPQPLSPSWL